MDSDLVFPYTLDNVEYICQLLEELRLWYNHLDTYHLVLNRAQTEDRSDYLHLRWLINNARDYFVERNATSTNFTPRQQIGRAHV